MNKLAQILGAVAVGLILTGCATPQPATPAESGQPGDLLTKYGLQGLTAQEIIDKLDRSETDRTQGPKGSVRSGELVLSDETSKVSVPLPDRFYLSMAPYLTHTHDCFNHNLASCKGELVDKTLHVTIVDASGATLVDQDATTYGNGFVGFWLPKDIKATVKVAYEGKTAQADVETGADDPTCLTTLKLG